jgi:hypothetical protein
MCMEGRRTRKKINAAISMTTTTIPAFAVTIALLLIIAAVPAIALPSPAFAATFHISGEASCKALPLSGGNATWNSSEHQCAIPAGSALALSGNSAIAVDSGIVLVNQGAIQNSGGGVINIAAGAKIHNKGTFDNTGKVGGSGSILNDGVLNNAATIAISSPGGIENAKTGILSNSGFIHTGSLANAGTLFNSGVIDSKSHIENSGTIVNGGTIKSP